MRNIIYLLFLALQSIGYVLAEDNPFTKIETANRIDWLTSFGREWTIHYIISSDGDSNFLESKVKIKDDEFICELIEGEVKTAMLYLNGRFVCLLDLNEGAMRVPPLCSVSFDLRQLKDLRADEFVAFDSDDPRAITVIELKPGVIAQKLVKCGLTIEVYIATQGKSEDAEGYIGKAFACILVANTDYGVFEIDGNIKDSWSLTLTWESRKPASTGP